MFLLAAKYAFFSVALFAVYTALRQLLEKKFFLSLPQTLKAGDGNFNFSRRIMTRLLKQHSSLLKSASPKSSRHRSTQSLLQTPQTRAAIEKYVHLYQDEFADEVFFEKFENRHPNTRMFFSLMNHKFQVSNRTLVKAILYVIEEEHYFNFRAAILMAQPKSYSDLIDECLKYLIMNGKTELSTIYVKRLAYSLGFAVSLLPFPFLIRRAKSKLDNQVSVQTVIGRLQLVESSTEAGNPALTVVDGDYEIEPEDFKNESLVDRFYTNHLRYSLIQHFGSQCAGCERKASLNLALLWRPKNQGGNFAMRTRAGEFVNNCIPLCRTCSEALNGEVPADAFDQAKLNPLLERSWQFNSHLNPRLRELDDNSFLNLFKKAA